jgi:hypothetical protein
MALDWGGSYIGIAALGRAGNPWDGVWGCNCRQNQVAAGTQAGRLSRSSPADAPSRVLEKSWSANGYADKMVLWWISPPHGKIGRLSLVHSAGERLLADSNLLQGEFRRSLGLALEQCIISMPENFVNEGMKAMAHRA